MELVPFSIKLSDLIEHHYSYMYLHGLKSMQALMQGKSIARGNLKFLGTPHLYHDQAKCIIFFLQVNLAPFRRGLRSVIIKIKIDTNLIMMKKMTKNLPKNSYLFNFYDN